MSDLPTIAVESILAALIEDADGLLIIPAELLRKDREGKVIAIDYDQLADTVHFTLIESDDIDYDDSE